MAIDHAGAHEDLQTRDDFARELTLLRLAAGLTVRDLAQRLALPTATLGDYFSGKHLPSPKHFPSLQALLRECGVRDDEGIEHWLRATARIKSASDRRVGAR